MDNLRKRYLKQIVEDRRIIHDIKKRVIVQEPLF
jgi:hypothetical protein